ncbi:MAG: hypothetical protein WAM64_09515, partial [Acidimicrobiales bacterium]
MKSFRTIMIASVAAFSLSGAGTAIALGGLLANAGASGTNCVGSSSTSVTATTHHAPAKTTTNTGTSASVGTNHGSTTVSTTSGTSGTGGNASSGVSVVPTTTTPLITVNADANGTPSATSPAASGGGVISVNANTGNSAGSGLVKSVVGTVTNAASQRGEGLTGVS